MPPQGQQGQQQQQGQGSSGQRGYGTTQGGSNGVPPSYEQAVKGDNKMQT